MKIMVIPPDCVDRLWPQLEQYMQPVVNIAHGEVSMDGIRERLNNGSTLAIGAFADGDDLTLAGCCVVAVSEFPDTGKRVLEMPYVGGLHMQDWLEDGLTIVRNIARDLNCTHLRGCGRPGWERALPELKKIRTVYECEV